MIEGLEKFLRLRGVDFDTFGTVFDIGSRDGRQAVELSKLFKNANVVAIECNPATLEICRRNIAPHDRIRLAAKAINDYSGRCSFYPIDPERTVTTWQDGNPGASSLFLATGDYPIETYVQNKIEVDCIRLDELSDQFGIDAIDLIWMDLQGAELLALRSAGALLDRVRFIYTEVSHRAIYKGQCLFPEIESFLTARGFERRTAIDTERWQQDAIYENTRDLADVVLPLGARDLAIAQLSVKSVRSFVSDVRNVYVVATDDPRIPGTRFVDERSFPFAREALERLALSDENTEAIWRQLLRLHFPAIQRQSLPNVLAIDAGTIFLRACRFLDDGRPVLNFGDEYDPANFEHMARLFPGLHRMFAYSGVTHAMLLKRAWLEELHRAVEAAHPETPFWKAYLDAIDADRFGASDYEIYFNFCLMYHAAELTIRRFRWRDIEAPDEIASQKWDYVSLAEPFRTDRNVCKALEQRLQSSLRY
jgi:FkbM family methyltransferase